MLTWPLRARRLITLASIAAASVALSGCGSAGPRSAGESAVTFVSNGGNLQDAQEAAWLKPYAKETGVSVVQDVGSTDYAKIKAMVDSGRVTWDLLDVAGDFGADAKTQALLQPLDCAVITCADGDKYRVPLHTWAAVLAFNDKSFKGTPKSWKDFFDIKTFPGKRVVWKEPVGTGLLEGALLADGVAPKDLYPIDVNRALAKLKTIKDSIIWSASPTETIEALSSGEASMGLTFASQVYAAVKNGSPLHVVWDGYGLGGDYLVVLKGAPSAAQAMKLAAYITSVEHNADLSKIYPVAPATTGAAPDPKAPTYGYLPAGKGGTSYRFDDAFNAKQYETVSHQFVEWLQK
ncbi:extracellular solute-binding protein [Actinomadura sp. NPDC048955]|uniref:extracellular solute-binding protein n=1 Tax=Actinomadura sp. NPDC048955 TaxID=3158228 RepID=UPI0033DE6D66